MARHIARPTGSSSTSAVLVTSRVPHRGLAEPTTRVPFVAQTSTRAPISAQLHSYDGPVWTFGLCARKDETSLVPHAWARRHLFRHLAGPAVRGGHRRDAPGRDRRSSTHTVANVRTTANEASAMRLAPVPPWKVSP